MHVGRTCLSRLPLTAPAVMKAKTAVTAPSIWKRMMIPHVPKPRCAWMFRRLQTALSDEHLSLGYFIYLFCPKYLQQANDKIASSSYSASFGLEPFHLPGRPRAEVEAEAEDPLLGLPLAVDNRYANQNRLNTQIST